MNVAQRLVRVTGRHPARIDVGVLAFPSDGSTPRSGSGHGTVLRVLRDAIGAERRFAGCSRPAEHATVPSGVALLPATCAPQDRRGKTLVGRTQANSSAMPSQGCSWTSFQNPIQ